MSRAFILIRDAPWYRREAFARGLTACGFQVLLRAPDRGAPGDVLVIWNRYAQNHEQATMFEREGGTVLVAENGYLGAGGSTPKFDVYKKGPEAHDVYALGLGFHNDSERMGPERGGERWASLGIELRPWRERGTHVLVCANRSFGVAERIMHPDWAERCARRLSKETSRRVVIRKHPGNDAPRRPLSDDLVGAWAVFVWSSSVAVHSLVAGVPTFIEASFHSVKGASARGRVDAPECPDRLPNFERMAWGQWRLDEVERGDPFRHLLGAA